MNNLRVGWIARDGGWGRRPFRIVLQDFEQPHAGRIQLAVLMCRYKLAMFATPELAAEAVERIERIADLSAVFWLWTRESALETFFERIGPAWGDFIALSYDGEEVLTKAA